MPSEIVNITQTFTATNPATDFTGTKFVQRTLPPGAKVILEAFTVGGIPTTAGEPNYDSIIVRLPFISFSNYEEGLQLELTGARTHSEALERVVGLSNMSGARSIEFRVLTSAGVGVILTYLMLRFRLEF